MSNSTLYLSVRRWTTEIHFSATYYRGWVYIDENKSNGFSSYIVLGCARGATSKLRARAPARAQTGLLYIGLLVSLWGRRTIKNLGDKAIGARALLSKVGRNQVVF